MPSLYKGAMLIFLDFDHFFIYSKYQAVVAKS